MSNKKQQIHPIQLLTFFVCITTIVLFIVFQIVINSSINNLTEAKISKQTNDSLLNVIAEKDKQIATLKSKVWSSHYTNSSVYAIVTGIELYSTNTIEFFNSGVDIFQVIGAEGNRKLSIPVDEYYPIGTRLRLVIEN